MSNQESNGIHSNIRVRYAPSPTGENHIGNIRTAIYNYAFAKSMGGSFLVRLEDTDIERSKKKYEDYMFNTLKWLNIQSHEETVRQSSRILEHKRMAYHLLKIGAAYYCDCPKGEDYRTYNSRDKNLTSGVLRFKVPKNTDINFKDCVYGDMQVNSDNIEDFVLLRSDGTPTYMLAVVIDDIYMNITHIIRGEDHKTNTFKQILIYQSLKHQVPIFAHLPLIMGANGKKLSKRHDNASIEYYRKMGLPASAVCNGIVRLGWGKSRSHEEIYTMKSLIDNFVLEDIKKSNGRLNEHKMLFFSKYYMKHTDTYQEFYNFCERYSYDISEISKEFYSELASRSKTFIDIIDVLKSLVNPVFTDKITLNEYNELYKLWQLHYQDKIQLFDAISELKLSNAMRVILIGKKNGPPILNLLTHIMNIKIIERFTIMYEIITTSL